MDRGIFNWPIYSYEDHCLHSKWIPSIFCFHQIRRNKQRIWASSPISICSAADKYTKIEIFHNLITPKLIFLFSSRLIAAFTLSRSYTNRVSNWANKTWTIMAAERSPIFQVERAVSEFVRKNTRPTQSYCICRQRDAEERVSIEYFIRFGAKKMRKFCVDEAQFFYYTRRRREREAHVAWDGAEKIIDNHILFGSKENI